MRSLAIRGLGRTARPAATAFLCVFPTTARRTIVYEVPKWVESLTADAAAAEKEVSYDIKIFDEMAWMRRPYMFDKGVWDPNSMSSILRQKLCLGNEYQEYTLIGEAFAFPDRNDSPVVNEPNFTCKLWWDHSSKTEKLLIQLSDHFPPLLWLAVKPTLTALRRIFREFIDADAEHMKKYLPYYEGIQNKLETSHKETFGEGLNSYRMKDAFTEDMRARDPTTLDMDWQRNYNFYKGTTDSFVLVEDKFMKDNPFVFGWPLLLSEGNHYLEDTPLRMAAFRTIFSKSLVMLHSRLDLQLDNRLMKLGDGDEDDITLEVPVFCQVNYPENSRMCGGAALVDRYNKAMGTQFPADTPVDVLAAFAKETVKGVEALREEVDFLAAAAEKSKNTVERVPRLADSLTSANRIVGQLAYNIVYCALSEDPTWEEGIFRRFHSHENDMIRLACAKGVQVLERHDLMAELLAKEPEGRPRLAMLRVKECMDALPPVATPAAEGLTPPAEPSSPVA